MRDQDATVLVNFNREEEMARLLEQAYGELGKAYYEGKISLAEMKEIECLQRG